MKVYRKKQKSRNSDISLKEFVLKIPSVIEQLWTALENAQETLEELIAFYVEVGDESGKKEAIE